MPWNCFGRWPTRTSSRRRSPRTVRGRLFRPVVEMLEDRLAPATFNWDGGGGNFDWNNAPNWDHDQLPGSIDGTADIAIIGAAFSGITVTHSSGTTAIGSLTSAASLALSGGSFSLASASTINNAFTLSGGTLTGAADLTVSGTMTWTGGTQAGSSRTVLAAGASLNIPSGGPDSGGRAIDATASGAAVNWTGGALSGSPFSLSGPLNISGPGAKALVGVTVNKAGPTTWTGGEADG